MLSQYTIPLCIKPLNVRKGKYLCHEELVYLQNMYLLKMFLKPVWVGKIHGVEVYATHVVRIWWFSNKFSIFQLKRM